MTVTIEQTGTTGSPDGLARVGAPDARDTWAASLSGLRRPPLPGA
jgi:hypothetical protein